MPLQRPTPTAAAVALPVQSPGWNGVNNGLTLTGLGASDRRMRDNVAGMQLTDWSSLSPTLAKAWRETAEAGATTSPFQTPFFAQAAHEAGLPVQIAVAGSAAPAFLALQPARRGLARPLAGAIADVQAWCGDAGPDAIPALLRGARASALVASNWPTPMAGAGSGGAHIMDLSGGFAAWEADRQRDHAKFFKKLRQRQRKAIRECGSLRLEINEEGSRAFDALIAWKSSQYRASGKLDVLGVGWVQRLLQQLRKPHGPLTPVMSALYLGDRLAAVEFGLRFGQTYHSWFPAYDPSSAAYGPGHLLLHELARRLSDDGVTRIDLGVGADSYKEPLASLQEPRGKAIFLRPGLAATRVGLGEVARGLPLPGAIGDGVRKLHGRWAHTAAFEPVLMRRFHLMGEAVRAQAASSSPAPLEPAIAPAQA